jgi:prepilin-type N-terminal cleavage/methylation domain-containing protein
MRPPLQPRGRGAYQAFTLIELLTVIAIIGVLAAISFPVMKGMQERAAVSKARTELSAISAALESYKRQYGDYPQTGPFTDAVPPSAASASNTPGYLFNALAGKLGPKRSPIAGKSFLDLAQFTWMNEASVGMPALTGTINVDNALLDPWGRPYIYAYRDNGASAAPWLNSSFVLLSAGPDGRLVVPDTGIVNQNHADNLDNVYAAH